MVRAAGDDLTAPGPQLARRVGARIREQRKDLGWTLAETARAAKVSVSYLSSIETGNSLPSLPIVARIAVALNLPLHELLRDLGGVTAIRSTRVDEDTVGVRLLSHGELQLRIAALVCDTGESGRSPLAANGQDVFVYVHAGALEVVVDSESYLLRAGDSLDADDPRAVEWNNASDGRTVSIWALGPRKGS